MGLALQDTNYIR